MSHPLSKPKGPSQWSTDTEVAVHPYLVENIRKSETSECWVWTGPSYPTGYPLANFSGQKFSARRLIHEIHGGTKKGELRVSCGNVKCVNPEHVG